MTDLAEFLALSDAELDALDPHERVEYERMLELELALVSPADFATTFSHGLWEPYRHLQLTSDAIVGMVERDDCDCLVVEQPVRHGKTELCSRWTPAWYVTKHRKRVLLASYEADFAATHGRRAREITDECAPFYGLRIDGTSKAAHRWALVGHDAGMNTAGAGGPITGKGGHLLIVDDPIKNREEADSALMRERLWEWWQSTFLTRREPGGKVLVIMSRWHNDDLVARLVEGEFNMRIKRIRLPALAEDNDPMGRAEGEALCPERYDRAALLGKAQDEGPHVFAALYQQRPMPMGGGMFKRETFRYWSRANDLWKLGDEHLLDPADCWTFATMDPAFTRSKRSDYTAAAVWAVTPTNPPCLVLVDRARVRVNAAEHAQMVENLWTRHRPAWFGIERQNATLALFADVQRRGVVVRELRPDRNKQARAEVAVALMESGRIYFPRYAPWLDEWEAELVEFPYGAHDDQVDILAYAANELARGTVHAKGRRRKHDDSPEQRAARMIERRSSKPKYHPTIGRIP